MRRAVFLDRDGTVLHDPGHLHRKEEVSFLPGAVDGLRRLGEAGFALVFVTNQSVIAQGIITEEEFASLDAYILGLLAREGVRMEQTYYCPHHPEKGKGGYRTVCDCRKPKPGLLLKAADELGIDLRKSFMVGDKPSDIAAGAAAGCTTILVLTGEHANRDAEASPDLVADDLRAAAQLILRRER